MHESILEDLEAMVLWHIGSYREGQLRGELYGLFNDMVLLCDESPKNAEHPFVFVHAAAFDQATFDRPDKKTIQVKRSSPGSDVWRVRTSTATLADDWMKAVHPSSS